MPWFLLENIFTKQYGKQDTNQRKANVHEIWKAGAEVTGEKLRNVMYSCFEDNRSQTGKCTNNTSKQQYKIPVIDMTHTPYEEFQHKMVEAHSFLFQPQK